MKRDQYIPHEVSMRNTSEVMNLIEKEGMKDYRIRNLYYLQHLQQCCKTLIVKAKLWQMV